MSISAENPIGRAGLLTFVLLALLFGSPGAVTAGDIEAASVKAAFVLNFAKFTAWPADAFSDPEAPIELLVLGGETIRNAFTAIEGQSVGNRKIRVRLMEPAQTADNCHMMFFDQTVDQDVLTSMLAAVAERPVLTVGSRPDFIHLGGIINVFDKNGRFHFEIRPAAASHRDIKISSRLLKLAIVLDE